MRRAMGIAVFSGMIGVTLFGLFLTPVFYVTLMKLGGTKKVMTHETKPHSSGTTGVITTLIIVAVLALSFTSAKAGPLTIGPDYKAPTNVVPQNYKGTAIGDWKKGEPLDNIPKGNWWTVFGDTNLDALETQALQTNQMLRAAIARVDEARATARVTRSEFFPYISADPSYTRQRYSPNSNPSFGTPVVNPADPTGPVTYRALTANTFNTPLDLSYELDIWGRIRRSFQSSRADAQATAAEFYNVLLTLNADVAINYFQLRSLDAEISAVTNTVSLRHEQVRLVRSQYEGGIGSELEVSQAETELATTEAELAQLAQQRDQLENALAILVGQNPATFQVTVATDSNWNPPPPEIPAGLPADLLQRRPDVAQAERNLASANAKIGVAKAAFFPVVTLTASGGYLSGDVTSLFTWESRAWSFGPSISLPIFAGGRNRANLNRAHASYEEAVANYRQQVLVAFGDVENSLSAIRHLADQSEAQTRAVKNATRATDLATDRYRAGVVAYIEVVDASRDALTSEQANAQLAGQRLIASVQLIKALGGGWETAEILSEKGSVTVSK
jgi:multidrug efflux system outer membrane protein